MYVLAAVENVPSATPLNTDASTRRIGTPPPMGMAARIDSERMNATHERTLSAAPPNAKSREPERSVHEPTGKRDRSAHVAWTPRTAPTTWGPSRKSRTPGGPTEVLTIIRQ